MRTYIILLVFFGMVLSCSAQKFANTLSFDKEKGSPAAEIDSISWLAGHWRGNAFGGVVEEIWSPPFGGTMMFSFKLVVEDEVQFYELGTIAEEDASLILRLKHFNKNLTGWEEKDESVEAKLVKIEPGKAYFDGFTFEYISENEVNIFVVIDHDGVQEEMMFKYRKFVG